MAANFNSGWYQAVLVLHLVGAVVGFGGSALGSVMLRKTRVECPEADQVVRRALEFGSARLTEPAAYLAGIAGVVAVLVDDRWTFRQGWVTAAFLLYFAWAAIAHGALRPTLTKLAKALNADLQQRNPELSGELPRLRKRAERWYMASNLVIVAAIIVMVTKPGL